MVLFYKGQLIEDMPKEELIKLTEDLYREVKVGWNNTALKGQLRNIGNS